MTGLAGVKPGDTIMLCWPSDAKQAEVTSVGRLLVYAETSGRHRWQFRIETGENNTRYTHPYALTMEQYEAARRLERVLARLGDFGIEVKPRFRERFSLEDWERVLAVLERAYAQPREVSAGGRGADQKVARGR